MITLVFLSVRQEGSEEGGKILLDYQFTVNGFVGNMFKFKSSQPNVVESNPIWEEFVAAKQVPTATAGPEHVWRIFDAYRKSDGQVGSIIET